MSSRDQAQILIAGIGGLLALTIFNLATQYKLNLYASAAIGIAANILFVTFAPHWLVESIKRYGPYRKLVDSRSCLEGYWLSLVDDLPERPYEVAVISYNPDACTYTYSGKTLSENFNIAGGWRSTHLEVNMAESRIRYFYEGSVTTGNVMIQGSGHISFDRAPSGKVLGATGIFMDADQVTGASFHRHSMRRITDLEISGCLPAPSGKWHLKRSKILRSDEDYGALVQYLLNAKK